MTQKITPPGKKKKKKEKGCQYKLKTLTIEKILIHQF